MFKGVRTFRKQNGSTLEKIFSTSFVRQFVSEAEPFNSKISCGLILSRIPLITKEPTRLEKLYWEFYNKQEESGALPFAAELYFKKGSLNERKWRERQGLVQNKDASEMDDEEYVDEEVFEEDSKEFDSDIFDNTYKANSRVTEADKKNDITSLERALENHLYLVTKTKNTSKSNYWEFPCFKLKPEESLYAGAERELSESFGENLDLWQVGHSPIGHITFPDSSVFFMKAHILAGQVDLGNSPYSEFAWLTLSELKTHLSPEYFANIKTLLS